MRGKSMFGHKKMLDLFLNPTLWFDQSLDLDQFPGLQLRNSEQNCFHDTFLISQPNPMM